MSNDTTRRDFLKTSAVAGGVLAANLSVLTNAHAQQNDGSVRVGLIGCGGRGGGAIQQCLRADNNARLVAVADTFRNKADGLVNGLRNNAAFRAKIDVPAERVFIGLDAFQNVIQASDLVILATPPGFRPLHIQAAINARKHLFTEKPVGVDGPGIRMVLAAFEEANRHNLTVVAGTQRRYQTGYLQSMQRIHGGDIGTITSARCYWNQGALWHVTRPSNGMPDPGTFGGAISAANMPHLVGRPETEMTDLEWQIRNWLYFTWLSGDHICEQHVHNLDVINWALGNSHPTSCVGMGGRQVRTQAFFGNIFDHFTIEYTYPNDVHVLSMCRQIQGCDNNISEAVTGTRGSWASRNYTISGERAWSFPRRGDNQPYDAEHVELFRSIRGQRDRINDLKRVAESTLTAIMGRMSAYTGKTVSWEQALNSQQSLMPARLTWDMKLPVPAVAVPGTTQLI